jgi:hypothetical protein
MSEKEAEVSDRKAEADETDSVRTVSTTVASVWTNHETQRRLLQKHFLVTVTTLQKNIILKVYT